MLSYAFITNDHGRFAAIYQRGFELLAMAALPILAGGAILAEPLLVAIGTEAYAPAAPVLRLLLIAVVASFLNGFGTHSVTIIGRQKKMVWSYLTAAVLGLTLYLTLVPRYGMYGAAIGTIFTETLVTIIAHIFVLRAMHFRLRFKQFPKVILATLAMSAVAWFLREQNFYLAALASAVVYGVLIIVLKALPISTIKEIIGSRGAPVAVPIE